MMTDRVASATRCRKRLLAAAVCTALACLVGCALSGGGTQVWRYVDDFSTDAAIVDSYAHAAFVDSLPDIQGPAFLMYTGAAQERRLGFYPGGWVDDTGARLAYAFPLGEPGGATVTGGVLEFDLGGLYDGPHAMRLDVVYEGAPGGISEVLGEEGHYRYVLTPGTAVEAVTVEFHGLEVTLDNLRVSLHRLDVPGLP